MFREDVSYIEYMLPRRRSPSIRRGAATDSHFPGASGAPRKSLPLPPRMGAQHVAGQKYIEYLPRQMLEHVLGQKYGEIFPRHVLGDAVQDRKPGFRAPPEQKQPFSPQRDGRWRREDTPRSGLRGLPSHHHLPQIQHTIPKLYVQLNYTVGPIFCTYSGERDSRSSRE